MEKWKQVGETLSLKQQVYDQIKARIIRGELAPGTRLREIELSEEMNISRAPIREALNMLDRDGFAKIIPRKGAEVAGVEAEDIRNIWEMRCLIEPYAAEQSVGLVPDHRLSELRMKLERSAADETDMDIYMESDLDLHQMFADYLTNGVLRSTLENLKDHSMRMRWSREFSDRDEEQKIERESIAEHLEILSAFEARDSDAVREAVKKHIKNSMDRLSKGR